MTNSTYCLNTTRADFGAAQAACALSGGHLVIHEDIFEQEHVERYFLDMGFLLPGYHRLYWMGLQVPATSSTRWPNFTWVDQNQAIYNLDYQNWGYLLHRSGFKQLEPNNLVPVEMCAGANVTVMMENPGGWAGGWADHNCSEAYVSICEFQVPKASEPYTSQLTGATYVFNEMPLTAAKAEAACNAMGSRLASFSSLAEQAEVERYFMLRQRLIPDYHENYWIGLRSARPSLSPLAFNWTDFSSGPNPDTYTHWGFTVPDYAPEPNNATGQELCVVANYTERYDIPEAWGWADVRCSRSFTSMCKMMATGAYVYVSNTTNTTYILNTTAAGYATAAQVCNDNGGFLAAYTGVAEQAEVERFFSNMTYFVPAWHQSYWIGLRQAPSGGDFYWVDPRAVAAGNSYMHWGLDQPDFSSPVDGSCAAANSSYPTSDRAYMWSDANCTAALPFLCKIMRGWLAAESGGLTGVTHPSAAMWRAWVAAAAAACWACFDGPPACSPGPLQDIMLSPLRCDSYAPTHPGPPAAAASTLSATAFHTYLSTTGTTYMMYPNKTSQANAEAACNVQGGHLAYYASLAEQLEVEQHFISGGFLFPTYTPAYWIGLRSNRTGWPGFEWLQRATYPEPNRGNNRYTPNKYEHWGSSTRWQEPNNRAGDEWCAVANYTQSYFEAWGWSDASCGGAYPYICRADVPNVYRYFSNRTNTVYTLNTSRASQPVAEASCLQQGGHLAYFTSLGEQQEVEAAMMYEGGLIPAFHKTYWMGLTSNASAWPAFSWLEKLTPAPGSKITAYTHWAAGEPNNQQLAEYCGSANLSSSYQGAAGWLDSLCGRQMVYLCKTNPPGTWSYRSAASGMTYMLNTSNSSYLDAFASCREKRATLVSYESIFEQRELEEYFAKVLGVLLPSFNRQYWLGLGIKNNNAGNWPNFRWLDNTSGPGLPGVAGEELLAVGPFSIKPWKPGIRR
jgi:hypothetical protein